MVINYFWNPNQNEDKMKKGNTYTQEELQKEGFSTFKSKVNRPIVFIKNKGVYLFDLQAQPNQLKLIEYSDL
jgi:hypothetical protein